MAEVSARLGSTHVRKFVHVVGVEIFNSGRSCVLRIRASSRLPGVQLERILPIRTCTK
ncbi:hypothetical protein B296_00038395, partial [Ensete ventricosum]